jgi:hypothetical protein
MSCPEVAILILAHKNHKQLVDLVNHLKTNFSLYIHIDQKSRFEIKYEKNVYPIKKFKVYWGSYNQILATRELMKVSASKNYDRYLLISGQDLPIMSNQDIIKYFTGNTNIYLRGERLPAPFWRELPQGGLDRMKYYYINYHNNKLLNISSRLINYTIHRFQDIFKYYRKIPNDLYGGSTWFNLTHEAIIICLEKMYDEKYLNIFKYTRCADEIIIQSILYNSKLSSSIINDNLRYTDWAKGGNNPKVLTLGDFDKIVNSGKLFARKFDFKIDSKVIEKIYQYIA